MTNNRDDNSPLPASWTDALKIVGAGHALGLISCAAALAASGAATAAFYWLEMAAVLFASGIGCSLFSMVSIRSVKQNGIVLSQQLAIQRLVIACLLGLSSALAFFAGCATALLALVRA